MNLHFNMTAKNSRRYERYELIHSPQKYVFTAQVIYSLKR